MTKQINLKIDGIEVTVDEGTTILNAAKKCQYSYSDIVLP